MRSLCRSNVIPPIPTRHLAEELNAQGYEVSHALVAGLLHDLEHSLQVNRETLLEGAAHPDRNAQFEHINERVKAQLNRDTLWDAIEASSAGHRGDPPEEFAGG